VYLQADEIFHEEDHPRIREALRVNFWNQHVHGLLFDYVHFYGSFDVIRSSRSAYRREVRAVKKASGARSVGDAQSFRLPDGSKPSVVHSGGKVYHYGWVRPPEVMKAKTVFMDTLYHSGADANAETPATGDNYRYKRIWGLFPFRGTHPAVMRDRIAAKQWKWDVSKSPLEWRFSDAKKVALDLFERATGIRLFEYRSYRRVD
jgi:hypothetical protein